MPALITTRYDGFTVTFTEAGWFNATAVADRFGKAPSDWLRQSETVEYLSALHKHTNPNSGFLPEFNKIKDLYGGRTESSVARVKLLRLAKTTGFVRTRAGSPENGGGTWLHPKLAVVFARWLDVNFAVWCDEQIDGLLRGTHPHYDWKRLRHEATSSFKVMTSVLQMRRQMEGKDVAAHHFSNEARLINWAVTGEFKALDREALSAGELDLLAKLEETNSVLIGCGLDYAKRKAALERFAADWLRVRVPQLAA